MKEFSLQERIDILVEFGDYLQLKDERLIAFLKRTEFNNKWFTLENQLFAIDIISKQFLKRDLLEKWVKENNIKDNNSHKKIGIIPSDRVPLSVFHDIICVFITGYHSIIKLSESDRFVLPFFVKKMEEIKAGTDNYFSFPEKLPLKEIDGIVASGDKKIIKQFKTYFRNKKTILRNHKNSIAIIHGNETKEDFRKLAKDTLTYFGKSNHNVSKLLIPDGYDFNLLLETFHEFKEIIKHSAYNNNYDYQISLLILNKILHWNNGSIILADNKELYSPISVLNFEHYSDLDDLKDKINQDIDDIHNIISKKEIVGYQTMDFGKSIYPSLNDFENNINTLAFLKDLNN